MKISEKPIARRRSLEKHESIVRAAAEIADAIGYEKSTIEGMAERAGVGKQTIYRWWPSKAALYVETYRSLVADAPVHKVGDTCDAHLHRFLCWLFRRYKSTAAGKILVGLIAESTHNKQAADAVEQGLFLDRKYLLIEPIQKGIVDGEFDENFDVDSAAEIIVALIWKRLLTSPEGLTPTYSRFVLNTAFGENRL